MRWIVVLSFAFYFLALTLHLSLPPLFDVLLKFHLCVLVLSFLFFVCCSSPPPSLPPSYQQYSFDFSTFPPWQRMNAPCPVGGSQKRTVFSSGYIYEPQRSVSKELIQRKFRDYKLTSSRMYVRPSVSLSAQSESVPWKCNITANKRRKGKNRRR